MDEELNDGDENRDSKFGAVLRNGDCFGVCYSLASKTKSKMLDRRSMTSVHLLLYCNFPDPAFS